MSMSGRKGAMSKGGLLRNKRRYSIVMAVLFIGLIIVTFADTKLCLRIIMAFLERRW